MAAGIMQPSATPTVEGQRVPGLFTPERVTTKKVTRRLCADGKSRGVNKKSGVGVIGTHAAVEPRKNKPIRS
jgi:hypothetical protein